MTTQQILQGVHDWTNGKIVYDISVAHPDEQGNPTPYADLDAALGNGGANIPEPLRKGGMSIKFIQGSVQSSDNKYVQARCMAQNFTTDVTQWQDVDDEPTVGSDNLVKSGGVEKYLAKSQETVNSPEYEQKGITTDGVEHPNDNYGVVRPILLNVGETILLNKGNDLYCGTNVAVVFRTDSTGVFQETLIGYSTGRKQKVSYTNSTGSAIYIGICTYKENRSYILQNLEEAASKQSIADFLAIHGNPLDQEDALSVLGRINAASVFNYGYATIANNADVVAKTITKPGFQLTTNMAFVVRCYIKNTADNVTLNINNTGAKNLYYNGERVSSTNTWETGTYALLWYDGTFYWMYGLDINIIRNMFAAHGVTKSNNVNLIVRELYLTGLNPNNKYYVSTIRKDTSVSRWGIYINPEGAYGDDYAVAYFWADTKPNGFIKIVERNSSGINGYAIIDWSNVPDVGYKSFYDLAQIRNEIVSELNFNPSIATNLNTEALVSTKNELQLEIDAISEIAGNTGSGWQNVYDLANDIKQNRTYFLNDNYADELSFEDTSYLDSKIRNIPKGKHFIFTTDSHIDYYNYNLRQKETQIIAYVKNKLNAGGVVFGGDCIGQQNTSYKAAKVLSVYAEDKFNAFGPEFIWCQGNHDANANDGQNKIPSSEIYKRTTGAMQRFGKAVFDEEGLNIIDTCGLSAPDAEEAKAWMKLHYYIDDTIAKIRYIVLESGDGSNGLAIVSGGWAGYEAMIGYNTFIGNALQNAPADYDIVIVMHQMMGEANFSANQDGDYEYASIKMSRKGIANVFGLMSAFKQHTAITIDGDGSITSSTPVLYALMTQRIGSGVNYDFSNSNGRIFMITGHFHHDDAWVFQNAQSSPWYFYGREYAYYYDEGHQSALLNNAVLALQIDRACLVDKGPWTYPDNVNHGKSPNAVSYPNQYIEGHYPDGEQRLDTKNEVLFDVITLTEDNKVVCTRIGAGNDRAYNLPTQS